MGLKSYVDEAETAEESLMPDGPQAFRIEQAGVGPTKKDPANIMLSMRLRAIGGEFAGRSIFKNIILKHSNVQAMKMGAAQVQEILDALDADDLEPQDLEGEMIVGDVGTQEGGKGYPDKNDIFGWSAYKEPKNATSVPTTSKTAQPKNAQVMSLEDDNIPY